MASERPHPNVVHTQDVEPKIVSRGRHRFTRRVLGSAAGNVQLGASLVELEPGALSYPLHFHSSNEEAIYVLSGSGTLRIGESRVPIAAGDWIAFPIGPAHAHQVVNDSAAPLVYLVVATDHKCEVIGYPDSKKVAAFGGKNWDSPWIAEFHRAGEDLNYWDGEPDANE